ncbi:polysaccharide pyruvyl transferase family protein [Neiella sp. HB171785]|uniref:Polysaccharide pyruvyl transferase family protein n=1 Tax=Neiella litorisoli TaxID=2771431 RepID=A0A8J6QUX7_9GAMM|nr:polysaccharide pyruvyl transferase family protein [Neiella litorisoli]MBD1390547.1 polysaccharide pyruvyl transferase family protein [Neiella litorisoli]
MNKAPSGYVYFLSASDRLNYGDLLFPMIFKEVLVKANSKLKFVNCGLVESDLSNFGALPTISYRSLEKNIVKTGGCVVVGGGEVLFPTWGLLYSYINPVFSYLFYKYKFVKKFDERIGFSKRIISRTRQVSAFCVDLPNSKTFYNSVGGIGLKRISKNESEYASVKNNLQKAEWVSLRDYATAESLCEIRPDVQTVPDSALIMSDVYPLSELEDLISEDFKNLPDKYVVLQLGAKFEPQNLNQFVGEVRSIAERQNSKVVCCPIGLALGHDDHKVLKKICELAGDFLYAAPQNLFDIMYTIACSEVYLGTSLHGFITAQSFGCKFIPLNKRVHKMARYAKTWTEPLGVTDCHDYDNDWLAIHKINDNWDAEVANRLLQDQKTKVYDNINTMIDAMGSES